MMNFMWVIPWAVIIIFAVGWYFGGKVAIKKENVRRFREETYQESERNTDRAISGLYKSIDRLEEKIERIFAIKMKEEN